MILKWIFIFIVVLLLFSVSSYREYFFDSHSFFEHRVNHIPQHKKVNDMSQQEKEKMVLYEMEKRRREKTDLAMREKKEREEEEGTRPYTSCEEARRQNPADADRERVCR